MRRIKGETVVFIREEGGGYTNIGEWIPPEEVPIPVGGCVVDQRGTSVEVQDTRVITTQQMIVYTPGPVDLDGVRVVEVRGEDYRIDGEVFEQRSVFGTSLGGMEVPLTRGRG